MSKKDDVLKDIKEIIEKWECDGIDPDDANYLFNIIVDIKMKVEELNIPPFDELSKPMGDFILSSEFKGIPLADGQYYHYSDVCILLRRLNTMKLESLYK